MCHPYAVSTSKENQNKNIDSYKLYINFFINPLGPRPPVTACPFALLQNPRLPGSGADDPN